MIPNRVDGQSTPEQLESARAAVKAIEAAFPFLTTLPAAEADGMLKLGDKSEAFVSKALEVARANLGMLPRDFDFEAMERDWQTFNTLRGFRMTQLAPLMQKLDSTIAISGNEAYLAALLVYNVLKKTAAGGALGDALDELGKRWARKSRSDDTPSQPQA